MSSIDARARAAGRQATHSTAFEVLTRLGFLARGAIYVIIGLLAIQVAIHAGNETTNQRGAMQTIQQQPFGHWLLIVVAVGLGAYAAWRFVQAFVGSGPEGGGDHSTFGRIAAAASGCAYAALCVLAVTILLGSSSSSSSNPHKQTAGVLGWPGGQYLVGAAGAIFVGVALYQAYKGLSRKFLDEDKTEQMGETTKRVFTVVGVAGYLARTVAFGLIGIFLIRAAIGLRPAEGRGPGRRPGPARPPELRLAAARAGGRRADRIRSVLGRRRPLPADLRARRGRTAGDADANRLRCRQPHRRRRAAAPFAATGAAGQQCPRPAAGRLGRRQRRGAAAGRHPAPGTGRRRRGAEGDGRGGALGGLTRPPDGLVPVALVRDGRGRRPAGGGPRPAGRDRPPGGRSGAAVGGRADPGVPPVAAGGAGST